MGTATMINNTFWAILRDAKAAASPKAAWRFISFARSIIMLVFFFIAMPRIRHMPFRNPMLVGFALLAAGQVILITIPEQAYLLVAGQHALEACSYATVSTQMDRMIVVTVDPQERARIIGLAVPGRHYLHHAVWLDRRAAFGDQPHPAVPAEYQPVHHWGGSGADGGPPIQPGFQARDASC